MRFLVLIVFSFLIVSVISKQPKGGLKDKSSQYVKRTDFIVGSTGMGRKGSASIGVGLSFHAHYVVGCPHGVEVKAGRAVVHGVAPSQEPAYGSLDSITVTMIFPDAYWLRRCLTLARRPPITHCMLVKKGEWTGAPCDRPCGKGLRCVKFCSIRGCEKRCIARLLKDTD